MLLIASFFLLMLCHNCIMACWEKLGKARAHEFSKRAFPQATGLSGFSETWCNSSNCNPSFKVISELNKNLACHCSIVQHKKKVQNPQFLLCSLCKCNNYHNFLSSNRPRSKPERFSFWAVMIKKCFGFLLLLMLAAKTEITFCVCVRDILLKNDRQLSFCLRMI